MSSANIIQFYGEQQIVKWGSDRNICGANAQSTALGQLLKTEKEFGEWCDNHSKDDVGDIFVTLALVTNLFKSEASIGEIFSVLSIARTRGEIDLIEVKQYIDEHGLDATFKQQIELIREDIKQNDFNSFQIDLFVAINLLFNMANSIDATLVECIDVAWNDIKDRRGKMVHGLFVKQGDLDILEGLDVRYTELGSPAFLITNPFSTGAFEKLREMGFVVEGNRTIGLEK